MKILVAVSCLFISLSSFADHFGTVKFLEGCWSAWDENGNKVLEVWQTPTTFDMKGLSQTIAPDGNVLNQESLSMKWLPEAQRIQYQANINGELLAPFILDLRQSKPSVKAVFINPLNDFPKSISYELSSQSSLAITLSGNDETGAPFEITYELDREICE